MKAEVLIQCVMSFHLDMEAGEENVSDVSLKRPRAPLSDSEDNSCSAPGLAVKRCDASLFFIITKCTHTFTRSPYGCCFCVSETNDGQKRRRLEAAGQENRWPEASSGRRAELEAKPDTPIVPSVRSRVQLLTQRRDGTSSCSYTVSQITLSFTVVTGSSGRGLLLHCL